MAVQTCSEYRMVLWLLMYKNGADLEEDLCFYYGAM